MKKKKNIGKEEQINKAGRRIRRKRGRIYK